MKKQRARHLAQYGLGIVAAVTLSLLFVNSQVELDGFRRVDAELGRMRENIATIHQQLVELQAGSSRNYDRISAAETGLRDGIRRLQREQALDPVIGEAAAADYLSELELLWQHKYRAIEDFKARNALHKNLILYAPKNIEDLIAALRQSRELEPADVQEMENLLYRVAARMFIDHKLSSGDDFDVSELLVEVQGEMMTRLPEDLQPASIRLFDRLQLALQIEGQLLGALQASASTRLDDRIRELRRLLRLRLDEDRSSARNYRIGLYLLGLLMLFYLARVFLRMQELSRYLESSLSELEFQKRALDEHSIVTITDVRGDIIYANDRMCEISGYRREELIGNNHRMLKSGKHDADFYRNMWRDLVHKGKWQGEIVNRARNGRLYWVATTLLARYNEQGKPWQYIGIRTDITEQKKMEREARLLARFPSENPDPVLRMDRNGRILYHNPASRILLDHWGLGEGERLPAEWLAVMQHCLQQNQVESHDIHIGDEHYELRFTPVASEDYVNLYARNITEIRRAQAHLSYQARHDPLTGLYNRFAFEQFLDEALLHAQASDDGSLLLYIDLDQFKIVNDTSGHVAGDELLRQLGELFSGCIRESDLLARLGGDEFGILLNGCDLRHGVELAEKLLQAVNEYRFLWQGKSFKLGASIGIALINADCDSAVHLLGEADIACYAAKDKGRNRVEVYQPGQELEERRNEMHWAAVIPEALAQERFELYAQRIKPLQAETDEEHYELLLRLRSDDGSLIPPGAFLPAAERYGLMSSIDLWVVEHAFQQLQQAERPPSVAINLSGNSLGDDRFLGYLLEKLDAHDLDPSRISFEITETSAIANLNRAVQLIESLRERGCRFALDDFGSGLSSFAYLKNLPVDFLKIDGAFVRDILEDPIDEAMVQAINHIGHVMGIRTIAEFVESTAIEKQLKLMQVDFVQGYAIHRPQPLDEVLQNVCSSSGAASEDGSGCFTT